MYDPFEERGGEQDGGGRADTRQDGPSITFWVWIAAVIVGVGSILVVGYVGYRAYAIRSFVTASTQPDVDAEAAWLVRLHRFGWMTDALRELYETPGADPWMPEEPEVRRAFMLSNAQLLSSEESVAVRRMASQTLYWLSGSMDFSPVIQHLAEVAENDPDDSVREYALMAFGDARPNTEAPPFVLEALQSETPSIRLAAASALRTVAPERTPEAAEAILELLDSSDVDVLSRALTSLPSEGWDARPHMGRLIELTQHPDSGLRYNAVDAIAYLGIQYNEAPFGISSPMATEEGPIDRKQAFDAIRATLTDADSSVRYNSVNWLDEFGEDARPVIPDLVRMMKEDPDQDVRDAAAETLFYIDREAAITAGVDPRDHEGDAPFGTGYRGGRW